MAKIHQCLLAIELNPCTELVTTGFVYVIHLTAPWTESGIIIYNLSKQ